MKEKPHKHSPQPRGPTDGPVSVPVQYWDDLGKKGLTTLCNDAFASAHSPDKLILPVLGKEILVDIGNHSLEYMSGGKRRSVEYPLLELLVLVYLLNAKAVPLDQELVTAKELKTAHFFQGPHELRVSPLVSRFGRDRKAFQAAAASLSGVPQDLADAAYRFPAFPRVPVYYLLWEGDDEFEARMSVLFDRSVEKQLSADAIWGLVTLVTEALLTYPHSPLQETAL
jgi:hypothetical protein